MKRKRIIILVIIFILAIYPTYKIFSVYEGNKLIANTSETTVIENNKIRVNDTSETTVIENNEIRVNNTSDTTIYEELRVSELRTNNDEANNSIGTIKAFTEATLSIEQLIDDSDLIVKGMITEKLGEYEYETLPNENGESFSITRSLYEFDLQEVLKGNNVKNIKFAIGGTFFPQELELNKDYVLCLFHLKGDFEEAYSLISFSQAVFEVKDNEIINKAGEKFILKDFDKAIKEVQTKNETGIKINKAYDLKLDD